MNFWSEVPRASIFKHRPEPRHLSRTFSQVRIATTCCMHAIAFTQPSSCDCNVRIHAVAFGLSSIHATCFKPMHSLSSTSTSSYSLSCCCGAALMPQHSEDVVLKMQKDPRDGGSALRFATVAVTYATLSTCRRLQSSPGHEPSFFLYF